MNNMARIVGWQFAVVVGVAVASLLIGGEIAGISAALGGMICVIPNMMFVVAVRMVEHRKKQVSMGIFLVLEFLKIVLTMVFMVAAVWFYREVSWVYFLISLAIALKSYLLLLYKNRS
jgi:ATP synthase protein I